MSISGVGGVSPHAAFSPISGASKPESLEAVGKPDHDGDSDDRRVTAPPASGVTRGSVNEIA